MLSFRKIVEDDFEAVNQLILSQLHSEVRLVEQIGHYLIDAGGKRLRPLLVLLAAKALGYQGNRHIDLAVIIEFIHTATLLHDDVVDTSELRRGRFTANAQWGNAPSVLVGDFLYSRSFQMMVQLENTEVMRALADATNTIAEGEVQQLINIGDPDLSEADYLAVIGSKTARLFQCASLTAAILSDADKATCSALASYGWHLGIAFQLVDDALDYTEDSAKLGKNTGDDLAEGKVTLPVIHALSQASSAQVKQLRGAITNRDAEQLPLVVNILKETSALQYTFDQAKEHIAQAKQSLQPLADSQYLSALLALADFAVERNH